jgi:hypothetical protein
MSLKDLRISVYIAFHYNAARLTYLSQVLQTLNTFDSHIKIRILTNTGDHDELRQIQTTVTKSCRFETGVVTVSNMMHPYLLPWAHKAMLKQDYGNDSDNNSDASFTHFVYLEDDIAITPVNMAYWLENRDILKGTPFYPSLFRVEWNDATHQWYSTDVFEPVSIAAAPTVSVKGCDFINVKPPYQGLTIYDRDLLAEHMASEAFRIEAYAELAQLQAVLEGHPGYVRTRERATHGQNYVDVPNGFLSRNLLRFYRKFQEVDVRAWIHHLPNNYANDPASNCGKIPMKELLKP